MGDTGDDLGGAEGVGGADDVEDVSSPNDVGGTEDADDVIGTRNVSSADDVSCAEAVGGTKDVDRMGNDPEPARHPAPARQASLRDRNLALVLTAVAAERTPLSRADIATRTGLTKGTVSTLVDALIDGSFLAELEPRRTRAAGRPATDLVLSRTGLAGLGLEVNVDYLAASVVDLTGEVRHLDVATADQRGRTPTEILRDLAAHARTALDTSATSGLRVIGATVAVPGLVDGGTGLVRTAPNLGWTDADVLAELRAAPELTGLALQVGNEADLAALAELHSDTAGATENFLYISGEIGVGAGIVIDGAPFRGSRGWSGEIGHTAVGSDTACRCGATGCLETVAGQDALLSTGHTESVEALAQAARNHHPDALTALNAAGRALGIATSAALNILDLDTLILGGIYPRLAEWLLPPIEQELITRVLSARWAPPTVRSSSVGTHAAVAGAASSIILTALSAPADYL